MSSPLIVTSPGSDSLAQTTSGNELDNGSGSHLATSDVSRNPKTPPLESSTDKNSSISTLEPYTPFNVKAGKRSKFMKGNAISLVNFTNDNYDKYLTLEIKGDDVDIFAIHKDIIKLCGKPPKISPQSSNKIIICSESKEVSEKLKNLSSMGGASVECKSNYALNHSKGFIYAPQLMPYTAKKLEEELKDEGIVKVERMMKKIDGVLTPQPGLVLTFASTKLPNAISAAWYKFKVKQYIPRPRRCFYCQEFGHVLSSCRRKEMGNDPICVNCGSVAHGHCQRDPSCIHCGGNHPSSSLKCDVFLMEQEIQAVRITERISFSEARLKVLNQFIRPGISFASVVSNRNNFKRFKRNTESKNKQSERKTSKRTLSNESLAAEPPSKLSTFNQNLSASSLPELTVGTEEIRQNRSTSEVNLSLENAVMETGIRQNDLPSFKASSMSTEGSASLAVRPDFSGLRVPGLPGSSGPDLPGSPLPELSGLPGPGLPGSPLPDLSGSPGPSGPGPSGLGISSPTASLEATPQMTSSPDHIIPGVTAAEVYSLPQKAEAILPQEVKAAINKLDGSAKKKETKFQSSTASIKQKFFSDTSLKLKGKFQRPLQRNPRLEGQTNK